MTSTLRPRSIPADRITIRDIDAETLLYDQRTHKAWCLNQSSACIWRLCDGTKTLPEIAAIATRQLDSVMSEDLVLLILAELRDKELLEEPSAAVLPEGLSRRQMISKAGLAAAALLPVIAAITAPPASAANGSVGTGDDS